MMICSLKNFAGCAISVSLAMAAIGTVCCWAAADGLAGEIGRPRLTNRSTRMDLARGLDELDLPRYRVRQTNRGWEFRTRHFVIFSTTGKENAAWAADQLELAWDEMGSLADQWTDLHRQEAFGIGAVGALSAAAFGAVCPVCVVAAPALLAVGVAKHVKAKRKG